MSADAEDWLRVFEHPDSVAMCKTIVAHPDELTPRYIWLDWLDEHAPDLYAVQKMRDAVDSWSERIVTQAFGWDIFPFHGRLDTHYHPSNGRSSQVDRLCRSGAVGSVEFGASFDLGTLERWPCVVGVELTPTTAQFDSLSNSPRFSSLRYLAIRFGNYYGHLDNSELVYGLRRAPATNLRELRICNRPIYRETMVNLVSLPLFRGLCHLGFPFCQFGGGGVNQIGAAADFPELVSLDLRGCDIDEVEPIVRLLQSPRFPKLVRLDLSYNRLDNPALAALARVPELSLLERLDIRHNAADRDGVTRLSQSIHMLGDLYV